MDFAEAVSLVRYRGEIMQAAVPAGSGAMAAILGLDDDTIGQVCASAADDGVVEPVNFNSPGQVVIAGEADAVDRAIERAREQGARRAIKLQVSVPSHCSVPGWTTHPSVRTARRLSTTSTRTRALLLPGSARRFGSSSTDRYGGRTA